MTEFRIRIALSVRKTSPYCVPEPLRRPFRGDAPALGKALKPEPYKTITRRCRHEIHKIKGSRFIADAGPFTDEEALQEKIAALRVEYSEANHHCWAWRHGERFRYSDDGEPSGTAGRPLLQQIDGHGLDRVQVIVTRIFGGTKLGAGGLVRAYGAAARAVLDQARIVDVVPTRRVTVTLPYTAAGTLESIARAHDLAAVRSDFGEAILHVFDIEWDRAEAIADEIRDRTGAQARIEIADDEG